MNLHRRLSSSQFRFEKIFKGYKMEKLTRAELRKVSQFIKNDNEGFQKFAYTFGRKASQVLKLFEKRRLIIKNV